MRRFLVAGAVVCLAMLGVVSSPTGPDLAQAAAGTPGVPNPPVPFFVGDFENVPTPDVAQDFREYVGNTNATPITLPGMTYAINGESAEGWMWTPAYGTCNGWVTNSLAPAPPASPVDPLAPVPPSGANGPPAVAGTPPGTLPIPSSLGDPGCSTAPNVWATIQAMATALGEAQGMSPAEAVNNHALTAYTNSNHAMTTGYAGIIMKTDFGIPATGGHYYAVSAWFGEANCAVQPGGDASLTFSLIENGTPVALQSGLMPCVSTVPPPPTLTVGTTDVWITHLTSDSWQLPTGAVTDLGFQLYNAQDSGIGNDLVLDLVEIVDTTPQLYKDFSPATIAVGETTTLTYTITNSTGLHLKEAWNFTDQLPSGLTPVGSPTTGAGSAACVNFSGSASGGAVVASGDLAEGQVFCTVSQQVTVATGGDYVNGAANFPDGTASGLPLCAGGPGVGLCGLWAPDDATLRVVPALVDDESWTPYQTPVTVPVLANDQGVPPGSVVTGITPDVPSQGTWVVNPDGTVTFTPAPGFVGIATATYTVTYPNGTTGTAQVRIRVLPPGIASPEELAESGADLGAPAVVAAILLLVGSGLVVLTKVRGRRSA